MNPAVGALIPVHEVELKDAVFERAELDWSAGQARLHFSVPGPGGRHAPRFLVGERVSLLRCTRELRWTESPRVYELRYRGVRAGHRLEIELQSGDVVELEAESVGFEP